MVIINVKYEYDLFMMNSMERMSKIFARSYNNENIKQPDIKYDVKFSFKS